jgi:hypothetical protein
MDEYLYRRQNVAPDARAGLPKIENGRQTVLDEASDPSPPFASRAKGASMVILAAATDAVASVVEYWKVAVSVAGLVIAVDVVIRHF